MTALLAPARSRLWTPRHVVVTRSAAERPPKSTCIRRCQDEGLPLAVVMGGGSARQVEDTVDIQFQTVRLAVEMADRQ